MPEFSDICLKHVRSHKLRPNWRLFMRHDWERFLKPGWEKSMPPGSSVAADMYHQLKAEKDRKWQVRAPEPTREEIAAEKAAYEEYRRKLAELRWMLADLKLDLALQRLREKAYKANFNPAQPRVPAGSREGGQWTSDGGADSTGTGQTIANAVWASDGMESQATVQPAFLAPAVPAAIEAALALFTWLSSRNGPGSQAVFAFRADAFRPGATADDTAIRVGSLTKEQVEEACPRFAEVQQIANKAANSTDRGVYESAGAYGTAVHKKIEEEINGPTTIPRSPPRDPNFRAEASVIKSDRAGYGLLGSKRIDVLENPGTGTVCVYDIKTGESPLTLRRMKELADNVSFFYPGTQRVIVTEVRPGR
jgi:hypothetical protein